MKPVQCMAKKDFTYQSRKSPIYVLIAFINIFTQKKKITLYLTYFCHNKLKGHSGAD